jgi:MFS family permease
VARRFAQARSLALDISPLRESVPYRALWLGQIVSLIGSQMRFVAIPFLVFELTDSVVAVGLIGLVEVIPLIIFSIIAGAVADRMDRRVIMVRSQAGLIVTSSVFAVLLAGEPPPLWVLYALTAVMSSIEAFDRPARSAVIPSLVGADKVPAAMALRQVVFQVTMIVGPGIGGVLIGIFPVWVVFALDALSFIVALIALRWVPPSLPERVAEETQHGFQLVVEGLRFAMSDRRVFSIFGIDLIAMIFGMPRAVFPALAKRTFEIGASGLGLLYAAPSVGALVGALTTGWIGRVRRQGVAVLVAVGLWGVFITLAGISTVAGLLVPTLVFFALAGWSDVISAVFRGSMLQEVTPDHLRGRVSALNIMVVTGGPRLGDVEAGLVAGAFGVPASIVIGGAACLIGTTALAATRPLRSYVRPKRGSRGSAPGGLPPEEPQREEHAHDPPDRHDQELISREPDAALDE